MEKSIEFILGDKLPSIHEAVIAIYGYSPSGSPKEGRESKARKKSSKCLCHFTYENIG